MSEGPRGLCGCRRCCCNLHTSNTYTRRAPSTHLLTTVVEGMRDVRLLDTIGTSPVLARLATAEKKEPERRKDKPRSG